MSLCVCVCSSSSFSLFVRTSLRKNTLSLTTSFELSKKTILKEEKGRREREKEREREREKKRSFELEGRGVLVGCMGGGNAWVGIIIN